MTNYLDKKCACCDKPFVDESFLKGYYRGQYEQLYSGPLYFFNELSKHWKGEEVIFCGPVCSNNYHWNEQDKELESNHG